MLVLCNPWALSSTGFTQWLTQWTRPTLLTTADLMFTEKFVSFSPLCALSGLAIKNHPWSTITRAIIRALFPYRFGVVINDWAVGWIDWALELSIKGHAAMVIPRIQNHSINSLLNCERKKALVLSISGKATIHNKREHSKQKYCLHFSCWVSTVLVCGTWTKEYVREEIIHTLPRRKTGCARPKLRYGTVNGCKTGLQAKTCEWMAMSECHPASMDPCDVTVFQ